MAGEVIILVALFASVFGMVAMIVINRNKERMALIEKGADASLFYAKNKPDYGLWTLRLGSLLIGIALGILMGNILANNTNLQEEPSYFSMIALFGGLGLLAAFFLSKKYIKEEK